MNRQNFLAIGTIILGLTLFSAGLCLKLNYLAIDHALERVGELLERKVAVEQIKSGFNFTTLEGVHVGEDSRIALHKLHITTSLIQLLTKLRPVKTMKIEDMHATIPWPSLKQALNDRLATRSVDSQTLFINVIPKGFIIKNANFNIHDFLGGSLNLRDSDIWSQDSTKEIKFRIAKVMLNENVIAEDVSGEWTKEKNPSTVNIRFKDNIVYFHLNENREFKLNIQADNITVKHPLLSRHPFTAPKIELLTIGKLDLSKNKIQVRFNTGSLTLSQRFHSVMFDFSGSVAREDESIYKVTANIAGNQLFCADIKALIPSSFAPILSEFDVNGSIDFALNTRFETSQMSEFYYAVDKFKFNCNIVASTFDYNPHRLNLENPVQIETLDSFATKVSEDKINTFTPLEQMSKDFLTALLVSEDIRFFSHKGFEPSYIETALRRNLEEGRVVLGASTISMQTAKNLFLSREKTVSRKLQEAFLTWHLESSLSKERILEIYINIIEYGPGIHGIREASQHYFDKSPDQLTLLESTFLVALLPNPKRRYRHFCNRKLSDAFADLLASKLKQMYELDKISKEQFELASQSRLDFNNSNSSACSHRAALPHKGLAL